MSSSGVKSDALNLSGTNAATASGALNQVNPVYQQMISGNDGLSPQQMANGRTAIQQNGGGAVAGAVGQGGLLAARTGNAGGATAAIDDAARGAMATGSAGDLQLQQQSDQLAHQNQIAGLSGESQIYSDANGQANDALKTAASVGPGFWQQFLQNGLAGASSVASAYAGRPATPCYVAAELYGGWDEPRTVAIRQWLTGPFSERFIGRLVVAVYSRYGQSWAAGVRKSPSMRRFCLGLFNFALRHANRDHI